MNYRPFNAISPAPLAVFRIGFGLMMALSTLRFWANGWIEKLYLEPTYFFSYRYFEWVKPLGNWTYVLFVTAFVSSLMVMLGWKYRLAIVTFFLSFTYIELMDKTTYLNHYYFISLLSFVLIWLPAADYFSLDARGRKQVTVPRWTIDCLKIFVGVVYFYAGLAKLNSDWLLEAQPLAIWLPAKYDIPLLGELLQQRWAHYGFAWSGAAYDLLIPFLLLCRPTRVVAFVLVIVFHVLTRILFPIGMFPYIMIVSALVFFDSGVHERILTTFRKVRVALLMFFDSGVYERILTTFRKVRVALLVFFDSGVYERVLTTFRKVRVALLMFFDSGVYERVLTTFRKVRVALKIKNVFVLRKLWMSNIPSHQKARPQVQRKDKEAVLPTVSTVEEKYFRRSTGQYKKQRTLTPSAIIVALVLLLHLLVPWRYAFYPGELFWTEEGYRFSWRVMLMEKAGYLTYKVEDPYTGKRKSIDLGNYLTTFQQKQLATQPDFILEFAHFLASEHQIKDGPLPAIFAESYVALNGRGSRRYVKPETDLTTITYDTPRMEWLMPFEEDIYGL